MSACLCALFDLVSADVQSYRDLTTSFVNILKQVVEHRLPKPYNYHSAPAPFIQVLLTVSMGSFFCQYMHFWVTFWFSFFSWQIKLLKILAVLGTGDKKASNSMYSVLSDVLRKAEPSGNIGNALIYECISTIASIHPNTKLLESAAVQTSRFLKVRVLYGHSVITYLGQVSFLSMSSDLWLQNESHNLKYMGIDALGRIIKINPDFAEEHQLAVIDCLEVCTYL